MKALTLILATLAAGCVAEPIGSLPHVADLYPDELQATLDAWTAIKGAPGNVEAVRNATVTFGSSRQVTERCHGGTPLTGCTTMDDDGTRINVMLAYGADQPWLVCHELSHAIRGATVIGNGGDKDHTDPEIWGQTGVVNTAAIAIARARAVVSPPAAQPATLAP